MAVFSELKKRGHFRNYIVGLLICTGLILVLLLVAMRSIWAYTNSLSEFALAAGYEIQFNDHAPRLSLYPNVGVLISSAIIRPLADAGNLRRLRMRNVRLTLPLEGFQLPSFDNLAIEVESLTAIIDESVQPKIPSLMEEFLAKKLITKIQQAINGISGVTVSAQIGQIDLIVRAAQRSASTYTMLDSKIIISENKFSVAGDVIDTVLTRYPYEFVIDVEAGTEKFVGNVSGSIEQPELDQNISLSGQYHISDDAIGFSRVALMGPKLNIDGNIELENDKRQKINAYFNIHQLELRHYRLWRFMKLDHSMHAGKIFSDTGIELFSDFDSNVRLRFGAVRLNNQPIISGDINVIANDKKMALRSDNLLFLGGAGYLNVDVALVNSKPEISINSYFEGAQLTRLQIANDKQLLFKKGQADVKVFLKSVGNSTASLARSLNGYFMLASSNLELSQRYAEKLDRGVVSAVASKIKTLRKKRNSINATHNGESSLTVSCASVKLVVNNGYVEAINGLVAVLPDNTVLSSGYIDLHSEEVGFAFRTRKKKIFDWSALSLIKYVEIGGWLAKPNIFLDKKSLFKQGLVTTAMALAGTRPTLVYQLAESGLDSLTTIECLPSLSTD